MRRFVLSVLWLAWVVRAQEAPKLEAVGTRSNGWYQLKIDQSGAAAFTLQRSADLLTWRSAAVLHGSESPNLPTLTYIDPDKSAGARFYRVQRTPLSFEEDWRNQVFGSEDPFLSEPVDWSRPETRWIKFAILTNEPTRVYYQNSFKYKFHFDFAVARLPGFAGLSAEQFDAVSLRTNGQRVVLGTVLFPPNPASNQVGVQFVGLDPYGPDQIVAWLEIVRSTVMPLDGLKVLYVPTYEQAAVAEANRGYFAARGFEVGGIELWDKGQNAYSTGWAIGTLKFFRSDQLQQAYADGSLKPSDILFTDAIPSEIPYVAGIISMTPSTPNSHVALLARSYGVPFVYLADPAERARASAWIGKDVVLTAYDAFGSADIRLLDVSAADPALRAELAEAKRPAPIRITPKGHLGSYITPVDALVPADIKYFGGKAANFGFLRRQVASNSPSALAISFDLWDEVMQQQRASGIGLGAEISQRLSKYRYPPDVKALSADLQVIRAMIEDQTTFTTEQQQAIGQALLGGFDSKKKIRFRSSTNVEDSEEFVGAGLYDSYSGCLDDDLDSNNSGPSACDPTEANERGVFRAIRKVYASFYNENAVLERLRHAVDESTVGMAVLVHYSNPDEEELANGVATLRFERKAGGASYTGQMVTQKGAVSVSNPDGSARPEVVGVSRFFQSPFFSMQQGSTLVPLGSQVLHWTADYQGLATLFESVAKGFEAYYPGKSNYTLDFEYKKIVPGQLLVKQVRELPLPKDETSASYLLNSPSDWCVFQGEYGTVFANHRLKAKLSLTTKSLKLTSSSIQESVFGPISVEFANGNNLQTLEGLPASFPGAAHVVGQREDRGFPVSDRWRLDSSNGVRTVQLTSWFQTATPSGVSPIQSLDGLQMEWSATYANPQPVIEFGTDQSSTTAEQVWLTQCSGTNAASILVHRSVSAANVALDIAFFWPPAPGGVSAGYTAPLAAWKETRIAGLTTEPLILRGYYSQSYRPEHHNFSENFLFEPALEPDLPATQLAELEAREIRYIHVYWGGADQKSKIWVGDRAGKFRKLP